MTREQLNDFIDERIYPNSENEITAAKHNAVDKALADYTEDYADAQVASEVSNRNAAISAAISGEVSDRNSAIASAIASEVSARNSAINTAISQEVNDRNTAIGTAISTEVSNRNTAIDAAVLAARNARYTAFGATYDNGTWKMHGGLVTGITAAEMEIICAGADFNTGAIFAGAMRKGEKTNRPVDTYRVVRGSSIIVEMRQMARGNTSLQVFYIPVSGEYVYAVNDMIAAFMGCTALRIVKYLDVSRCASFTGTFSGCTALEECFLKGVDKDLDLGAAVNLTQDSLIYIVENAGTSAKELIFVSSLVTNWQATADYPTWSDFETYAASKNFTFNHNAVQHLDWDWEQ